MYYTILYLRTLAVELGVKLVALHVYKNQIRVFYVFFVQFFLKILFWAIFFYTVLLRLLSNNMMFSFCTHIYHIILLSKSLELIDRKYIKIILVSMNLEKYLKLSTFLFI